MKCENCEKEHDGTYGSGRFCSTKCARGFSTKAKRKDINEKISKYWDDKILKPVKCISCDNDAKTRRSKYCEECSKLKGHKSLFNKLNINETNLKIANEKALEILNELYFHKELSSLDIKNLYGIMLNTLYNFFKSNDIKMRNNSDANNIALMDPNKHLGSGLGGGGYKSGWHITWDGKEIYYRSSYELQYAKTLDELKIKYEVESIRIKYYDSQKNKIRIAIPDFYLVEENKIIEIKSNYTLDEINMKDKEKSYRNKGYNFELLILD